MVNNLTILQNQKKFLKFAATAIIDHNLSRILIHCKVFLSRLVKFIQVFTIIIISSMEFFPDLFVLVFCSFSYHELIIHCNVGIYHEIKVLKLKTNSSYSDLISKVQFNLMFRKALIWVKCLHLPRDHNIIFETGKVCPI